MEHENLSERVRIGTEQKAREGKWVMNIPFYGYKINKEKIHFKLMKKRLKLFEKFTISFCQIKACHPNYANEYQNKSGNIWYKQIIGYVLDNPIYIGT